MSKDHATYLDYAATTPLDSRVLDAMLPFFRREYGNPASIHRWGQRAEAAIETARERMAGVLGCRPSELVFTSGGSESDNLALRGIALARRESHGARHLLTTPVEHSAVLRTAEDLGRNYGFEIELLPVDHFGRVTPAELARRIRKDTALVSVIYANNEIGTINDLPPLGEVCRGAGVPLHSDAVQAASQLPLDVEDLKVDLLSLGAHKFYGPKGVGALYIRPPHALIPLQTGGQQERSRRAGTHNVPLIVGMAEALALTVDERNLHNDRYRRMRDSFLVEVPRRIPGALVTGHPTERLPNHASFVFQDVDGNELVAALDMAGFACSSGSACKTGLPEPSQVLLALGVEPELALGSLRATVGRATDEEEIHRFIHVLEETIERLRQKEPVLP